MGLGGHGIYAVGLPEYLHPRSGGGIRREGMGRPVARLCRDLGQPFDNYHTLAVGLVPSLDHAQRHLVAPGHLIIVDTGNLDFSVLHLPVPAMRHLAHHA